MSIRYIRLSNGNELFSDVTERGDMLLLNNPLMVEYGEMNGIRYPFLSRYNPYSENFTVRIHERQVEMMGDLRPEAMALYKNTLSYTENIADKLIGERLIEADQYMTNMAQSNESEPFIEDEDGMNPTDSNSYYISPCRNPTIH